MVTLPNTRFSFSETAVEQLQSHVLGSVFVPGDAGYDDARKAWNLTVEQFPAVIVAAKRPSDVVDAIHFARQQDLGVAIQSTGHGISRPADDALLIITSQMNYVEVDAEKQTAWVEPGALWAAVLEQGQAVGLAPLLGSSPAVGVMGYTLGGGMGWLARKFGLALDSVRYFEVVTADGRLLRVSQTENSDLFWGLRGGGGNFGVITGMEIQLYPVTTVYAGNLVYPVEVAKEVLTHYSQWIETVPEELTTSVVMMNFPPIPELPPFLSGKSVVMIRGCYVGAVEQGEKIIQQAWLDWMPPVANMFHAMPFSEAGTISSDPEDPMASVMSGAWLRELSDDVIDTLIQYSISNNGSSPIVMTEVRHAGGAISKVKPEANAFGNRDASLLLFTLAPAATPEMKQYGEQYISAFKQELQPAMTGGVYMNFLEGHEARQRTKDGYSPESFRRLMALKAKYDADNRFSYSFDIPPVKDVFGEN